MDDIKEIPEDVLAQAFGEVLGEDLDGNFIEKNPHQKTCPRRLVSSAECLCGWNPETQQHDKLIYVAIQTDSDGKFVQAELLDEMPKWEGDQIRVGYHEIIIAGYINGGDTSIERELDGTMNPLTHIHDHVWEAFIRETEVSVHTVMSLPIIRCSECGYEPSAEEANVIIEEAFAFISRAIKEVSKGE